MHYIQSYRFIFRSPKWLTNLALVGVCLLIPWIGQIVLIGYFFELIDVWLYRQRMERAKALSDPAGALGEQVMDALPADEDHEVGSYADFNFNRFSEYLTRGIWPFLVRMIANMAVGFVAGFLLMAGMMIAGFASAAADSPVLFFVLYGLFWVFYAFMMMLMGILTAPMYLHAGLSGDFGSSFSMEFYRDFMKRVGKEVVLVELFMAATGTVLVIVGLALCYIGIFPALTLIQYAHHHLEYQLYELYLERGGMLVERKQTQPSHSETYFEDEARSSHVMRPRPEERSTDVMRPEEEW
jgi:hypothetical protein